MRIRLKKNLLKNKSNKSIRTLKVMFLALIGIFVLLLAYFVIPAPDSLKRLLFPVVAVLAFIFFLLGGVLVFLTLKSKLKGKQKTLLLLTGISALGFLVFVILHNLFYALSMLASNIIVLKSLLEFLHVAFFIIAIV